MKKLLIWVARIIGGHMLISTAGLTCNIAMLPTNYVTDVYCNDEGGGITVHGGPRTWPQTDYEEIVSDQSAWLWLLLSVVNPHPVLYMRNIRIIGKTMLAYPLAVQQIMLKGSKWNPK